MVYENILELIGNTPIVKTKKVNENQGDIYVKIESFNPGGSVKDRPALYMINDALKTGKLKKNQPIIEATSGNMGIALAMIGTVLGNHVILVMPETMSIERRKILKAYGAELILTEGAKGMKGAVDKVQELLKDNDYFWPRQFENNANVLAHYETTAKEILRDFGGKIDAFVAGVGTGGTVSGVGKALKEINPNIMIVAVQPEKSKVLSGENPSSHGIQGIGANFIPAIYNNDVVDEIISVKDEDAFEWARYLAKEEGLLVGISSGANYFGSLEVAKKLGTGRKVITVLPDTGERYLTTALFNLE
ncbi:MAG: cysteine synthase A [Tissierellales bacterium]|nr:cysteine synthase A [Tissierellales bacterium]